MNEDKILQEFTQSAKNMVREKYPFNRLTLETEVLKKIQKQHVHQSWQKIAFSMSFAACLALCLYVFTPFWSGSSFREAGSSKSATQFEWIEPDEGLTQALRHGYDILPAIKTQRNGYTIEIKDMMVDQQRLVYTVLLSGEKIEAIEKNTKEEKSDVMYRSFYTNPDISISNGGVKNDYRLINGVHYFIIKADFLLERDALKQILSKPNPVLPLVIGSISSRNDLGKQVVEVSLAQLEELRSVRTIKPTATAKAKLGAQEFLQNLRVKQIELFPTIMRADIQPEMKEGYYLNNLENPRLVDGEGKEYLLVSDGNDGSRGGFYITSLYLLPSWYFDDVPQKLSLKFDAIVTSTKKSGSFVLERNGKYPLEAPFGNKKGRILQVSYDKDRLVLVLDGTLLSEEANIKIDGVDYDNKTLKDGTWIRTYAVPKKDTYQVDISRIDTETIPVNGEVPILGN